MNKVIWSIAGLLLVAIALLSLWPQPSAPRPAQTVGTAPEVGSPARQAAATGQSGTSDNATSQTARFNEAAFIADLRHRFSPHLHIKHAQIRTLEQLISYLKAKYPDDWESQVLPMLRQIFPELAEQLFEQFLNLQRYTAWLKTNRDQLKTMSASDRRAALWQARERAFGRDAQDIWAAELRSQQLADSLQTLAPDLSAVARTQAFREAIEAVYGEQADQLLKQRRNELLNHLIEQEPMQQQLAALPADQRRQTLRQVRASMGMPEDALQRWQELDQRRDSAWDKGQAYMQARKRLEQQYPHDAQWRIVELRQQHFGDMAKQIAQEEQAGFFRFAGPRTYGRE